MEPETGLGMARQATVFAIISMIVILAGCGGSPHQTASSSGSQQQQQAGQLAPSADASGQLQTLTTRGSVDFGNDFFKSLGSNGRVCSSCHQASDGWSVNPTHLQARFNATGGTDPIFRPNDGANCPNDDVSSVSARQASYALLLNKGLIRIARPIPASADFTLTGISDPYGCASASNLSLYRRPLPATNLSFETTIMWDARENVTPVLFDNLKSQAKNATLRHAQSAPPTDAELAQIVNFELALFTAQSSDQSAGALNAQGGLGGTQALSKQSFFPGINNFFNQSQAFNPVVFTLYQAWSTSPGTDNFAAGRASVARGEALFNTRQIDISQVRGLNDVVNQAVITGSCSTCHSTPNIGNLSTNNLMDIGTADSFRNTATLPLPVYTFQCNGGGSFQVTDPGFALTSGVCADVGKFKSPALRGLAARAPYFHNGMAPGLLDVVNFYNQRFAMNLTDQEKADLVAFLSSL